MNITPFARTRCGCQKLDTRCYYPKLFVGQKDYENQKVKQKKGNKADKEENEYVPLTALGSVLGKVTE